METFCPIETFPTSISSTKALTLTLERSAMVIRTVPPPTAWVGEEITWPTSTGLDITRNALISYNCDVGVAISGAYGTLSEIAFTLAQDKPLIAYNSWDIPKSINTNSVDSLITEVKNCLNQ